MNDICIFLMLLFRVSSLQTRRLVTECVWHVAENCPFGHSWGLSGSSCVVCWEVTGETRATTLHAYLRFNTISPGGVRVDEVGAQGGQPVCLEEFTLLNTRPPYLLLIGTRSRRWSRRPSSSSFSRRGALCWAECVKSKPKSSNLFLSLHEAVCNNLMDKLFLNNQFVKFGLIYSEKKLVTLSINA